jgi:hypothetical protein
MTRTFNPFAFFHYASNAELDNVVSYLRDCVNTHEWEVRGTPPSGVEFQKAGSCRHPRLCGDNVTTPRLDVTVDHGGNGRRRSR